MSTLMDFTAEQLADALDGMDGFPHNTGGLSMLDEATLAYGWKYATISPAQLAFSHARHAHKRSYCSKTGNYSDEAWAGAVTAAHALAADPAAHWVLVHSQFCEQRKDERGECTIAEADTLAQS